MKKLGTALIVGLLIVPTAAMAQFGPPAGFENMSGPPPGFDMSNIPSGFGGRQGPPANVEELQRQGQDAEARGKEMANKGLERMKKGAKGMQKAVDQMNKVIKKIKDAGYGIPAGVEDSLAKAVAAIATINAATEFTDDVQTALDDFNSFVDVLDENMESMQMLGAFPKIKKQADREVANTQKAFDKVKSKLANVGFDLTQEFADVQAQVDALKANYDKAIASAQAGNIQDAFDTLENDFFPAISDVRQSIGMLDAVKNLTRAAKQVDSGIKSAEKVAANLAKKGIDTSALQDIIAKSKTEADAFKASLKVKPFDPTDAVDHLDTLNGLREDFENEVQDQVGNDSKLGAQIKPVNFFGAQMSQMPKELQNGFGQQGQKGDNGNAYGFEKMDF